MLFGTLLEKAGAGNWMMQISIALLGHLRGGPAKVAVVSSALNGVGLRLVGVECGFGRHLHHPADERTGLSGVKAGAIEASASINGQIMPPVMGAAAFLMVEYVGIPYSEIVKHALLPAVFSYLALLYIVHLEAIKMDLPTIPQRPTPARERWLRMGIGLAGSVMAVCLLYWDRRGPGRFQWGRAAAAGHRRNRALCRLGLVFVTLSGSGDRRSERADPGTAAPGT